MKKIAIGLLGLSLALTLGGCGQKKTELPEPTPEVKGEAREELTVYTFDDSGVKFTLEVPKTWERIELLGYEGDEERDAELPQLFAVVIMSSETYAAHEAEIEAAVKSLKFE